jgi:hypothetical protein
MHSHLHAPTPHFLLVKVVDVQEFLRHVHAHSPILADGLQIAFGCNGAIVWKVLGIKINYQQIK